MEYQRNATNFQATSLLGEITLEKSYVVFIQQPKLDHKKWTGLKLEPPHETNSKEWSVYLVQPKLLIGACLLSLQILVHLEGSSSLESLFPLNKSLWTGPCSPRTILLEPTFKGT